MTLQSQMMSAPGMSSYGTLSSHLQQTGLRQVKVPKGRYNPAGHRKEFDNMGQNSNESIKEFITCLKFCSADCNFVCPFNERHDLTEYHFINRIRSGVANKALQQELLQKCDTLNTLKDITQFCENFESAKMIVKSHVEMTL